MSRLYIEWSYQFGKNRTCPEGMSLLRLNTSSEVSYKVIGGPELTEKEKYIQKRMDHRANRKMKSKYEDTLNETDN